MKKIGAVALVLMVCALVSFARTGGKTSLLIANCKPGEEVCYTWQLFRYDFLDGVFTGKEEIISSEEIRYDYWRDRIHRNRYLVTASGDVVDIPEKKILHLSDGELHRIEDERIYIRNSKSGKEGLYYFDIQTKKYELVRRFDRRMWFGKLSPNGVRSVSYRCPVGEQCGFEISELYKRSVKLEIESSSIKRGDFSTFEIYEPPVHWLDDERFITQRKNGELIVVAVKGTVAPLVKIKIEKNPLWNPRIYLNARNEIVYDCENKYVIDPLNKRYREVTNSLGNGFSVLDNPEVKSNWGTGKIYQFNGAEIGRFWANEPSTVKNYLAVVYGQDNTNLGYPDGVKVWNNITKTWTTFEIDSLPEIVGWITE